LLPEHEIHEQWNEGKSPEILAQHDYITILRRKEEVEEGNEKMMMEAELHRAQQRGLLRTKWKCCREK
jgi:hypothetical protein